MRFALALVVALILVAGHVHSQDKVPRLLGTINVPFAAFVEIFDDKYESNNTDDRYTLYVSTFNPINFGKDKKYYLRSPGKYLNAVDSWVLDEIDEGELSTFWANNPDYMPAEVAGAEGIAWTSGFLVPGKTKGAIELYDTTTEPPTGPFSITTQDTVDWSYHRVVWKDMDGDGDLDALTARFHKPVVGQTHTNFAWLENPGVPLSETPAEGWNQHTLEDSYVSGELGPDVHFRNFELVSRGTTFDCIVASEFWREQLSLYYTNVGWNDWTQVRRLPLDTTLGQSFDVYVDDFNRDGKIDILASAYDHEIGHVYVYEIPDDFRNGTFVKHQIATGFVANLIIGGQSMTPGSPKPFYPSKAYQEEVLPDGRQRKPYIMLSGDDDGKQYILTPNSEDPTDWTYTTNVLIDTTKTTSGKFGIADLDGDGYTEIIAAGYSANTLYVFTYAPEAPKA